MTVYIFSAPIMLQNKPIFAFFQILERDGTDIAPPERYVDADAVRFIETICKFTVFEGIHRRVVSVT